MKPSRVFSKVIGRRPSVTSYAKAYAILDCGHELIMKADKFPKLGAFRACVKCEKQNGGTK